MRNNNNGNRRNKSKSNKNMSNKDMYKALKRRDKENCDSNEGNQTSTEVFNDLSWYVSSEQILKDAARLPYNIPVGLPYRRDPQFTVPTSSGVDYVPHAYDDALPGIMVSSLMPMLGSTDDESSAAVNVAANSLFQYVRSHISGSRTYRPVDMMLYMGAMDSLYCYITWLTRLYGTVFTYHNANRYLSRALIEAQNVDYDDLVANLTNFRMAVNVILAKTRSLYLPSVLPIFLRHSWMFSHYFIEGPSEKDQIYCHMPAGYHVFTKDDNGAGALASVCLDDRNAGKLNVAHLIQALSSMIDPIYQDEDFNRIGGDMLKTYEGKVFTLTEIPDIVTVNLTYSEEVLLQFKNAKYKYVGHNENQRYSWKDGCFAYYQNAANDANLHCRLPYDALNGQLYVNDAGTNSFEQLQPIPRDSSMSWSEWSKDTLLTSPHADVEAGENMINTRLTLAFGFNGMPDVDPSTHPTAYFGSEWPVCYRLFTYHKNKTTKELTLFGLVYDRILSCRASDALRVRGVLTSQLPIRSAFKYLPELTIWEGFMTDTTFTFYESGRSLFEVDNYALVSATDIQGTHTAAILGEYNIPDLSVGK